MGSENKKLVIFDFAGTINCPNELAASLVETIQKLSSKYALGIISSSSSSYIKNYLKEKGILENFFQILGSDAFINKTERIESLVKENGFKISEAVYITDTASDIMEAKNAGVESIAVAWGLDPVDVLSKKNPKAIVNYPSELIDAVDNVFVP